jgi:feruloyl esterase
MKTRGVRGLILSVVIAMAGCVAVLAQPAAGTKCESLAAFKASNLTITAATAVDAPFKLGNSPGGGMTVSKPFCRVSGFLTPTSDSHIGFELWLPSPESWNHKFEAVGNGGFAGNLNLRAMQPGIERGYATMATDLGHLSNGVEDISWALNHPEKFIDYAYRAAHLTTEISKQIIQAYYGSAAVHSYYSGCSAGGIQGLTELLRYPKDYDGYIIGDATPDHMGQEIGAFWNTIAASGLLSPADAIQPAQISMLHDAILKQCSGKDGGVATDPFLTEPEVCKFDTKTLACKPGEDSAKCFSPGQIANLNKIFNGGPVDPVTHKQFLAPVSVGGEAIWDRYISGKTNPVGFERPWAGFMAYVVESDPDYLSQQKYLTFNFGSDLAAGRQVKLSGQPLNDVFNTANRDLDTFDGAGGKVIQYHGWDDSNIPPLEAVNLFKEVVADQAKRHKLTEQQAIEATEKFYRLFMVPGMGHCSGGTGPNVFGQNGARSVKDGPEYDTLSALERWVEKGTAPDEFIGSHVDQKTNTATMTRPLCAYPKVAIYNGSGDPNNAESFTCSKEPTEGKGKK